MSDEEVEASFISALDDAEIRQNCFAMAAGLRRGTSINFAEVLMDAACLYDWVMGEDDQTLEEAAEPASVTGEEECGPRRH